MSRADDRADDRAEDRKGLAGIERRLVDDDPALAQAFQQWQVPEGAPDARDGDAQDGDAQDGVTIVPPWVLAVFVTAAVGWVLHPGFGGLVAVLALSCVLVDADRPGRGRAGRRRVAGEGGAAGGPGGIDRRDDGGLPPRTWPGGSI
jgi:hypothetical protein